MNQYIIVEFDETREVIIDDNASGYHTGEVIELGAGSHTLSLAAPKDFLPLVQHIRLTASSPIRPEKISFYKV